MYLQILQMYSPSQSQCCQSTLQFFSSSDVLVLVEISATLRGHRWVFLYFRRSSSQKMGGEQVETCQSLTQFPIPTFPYEIKVILSLTNRNNRSVISQKNKYRSFTNLSAHPVDAEETAKARKDLTGPDSGRRRWLWGVIS